MPAMPGRSKNGEIEEEDEVVETEEEESVILVLVGDREETEEEEEEEEHGRPKGSGVMGNIRRGSASGAWGWK